MNMTALAIGRLRVAAAAAMVAVSVTCAAAQSLSGADIRREIIGRTIFLAAPLGGEFPLNYRENGTVDGNGEAVGLGRFVRPKDSGRWWVKGDQLCQQWQQWYDRKVICFLLSSAGTGRLKWVQDNGDSGLARIGGR